MVEHHSARSDSARSNAHEITSPFGPRSFNGKPQATANLGRSRLRLAVKRGDYFVSVATWHGQTLSNTDSTVNI